MGNPGYVGYMGVPYMGQPGPMFYPQPGPHYMGHSGPMFYPSPGMPHMQPTYQPPVQTQAPDPYGGYRGGSAGGGPGPVVSQPTGSGSKVQVAGQGSHVSRSRHRSRRTPPSATISRPPSREAEVAVTQANGAPPPDTGSNADVSEVAPESEDDGDYVPQKRTQAQMRSYLMSRMKDEQRRKAFAVESDIEQEPHPPQEDDASEAGSSEASYGEDASVVSEFPRSPSPGSDGEIFDEGEEQGVLSPPRAKRQRLQLIAEAQALLCAGTGSSGSGAGISGIGAGISGSGPGISGVGSGSGAGGTVPGTSGSGVSGQQEAVTVVANSAEAATVKLHDWNSMLTAVAIFHQVENGPVETSQVKPRLASSRRVEIAQEQPTRLDLHSRVEGALLEYSGTAEDLEKVKISPEAKNIKNSFLEPRNYSKFLEAANGEVKRESMRGILPEPTKADDDSLKQRETLFREVLAAQSLRTNVQVAMDGLLDLLPDGSTKSCLQDLSEVMHMCSIKETDYVASTLGTIILRRRDLRLNMAQDLSKDEKSELRSSSFLSPLLMEKFTKDFVDRHRSRVRQETADKNLENPKVVVVADPKTSLQVVSNRAKAAYNKPKGAQSGQGPKPKAQPKPQAQAQAAQGQAGKKHRKRKRPDKGTDTSNNATNQQPKTQGPGGKGRRGGRSGAPK